MSYADASDMVARFDSRTLRELVSDSGARVTATELLSNANLQTAMDDASGEIDAHVLQGQRYTTADLAELTGNSLAYLKRLNCMVAMAMLWERRPYNDADDGTAAEQAALQARKALDRLKRGEEIFDVEKVKTAGLPSTTVPSRVTLDNLNLTVDAARGHFYPARRLPGE